MNSVVFRVRRRFTERHRVVTGAFLPIAYAVDLVWKNGWWGWLILTLLSVGLILYLIFNWLIPFR